MSGRRSSEAALLFAARLAQADEELRSRRLNAPELNAGYGRSPQTT
jgi:hypothetical protein